MRNLTTALFLIFIFFTVSVNCKDFAKGSNQNPSSQSGTFYRRVSGKNSTLSYNRSFRDTLWEKRLKEWEKRQSAVPQSLPRVTTFKIHKHSSSRSYRASHRSFRASHHHRTRHVSRGRTHVRRRSRR